MPDLAWCAGNAAWTSAWMPLSRARKVEMPIGIAFLVLQGISELLRCFYAVRTGRWPQQ